MKKFVKRSNSPEKMPKQQRNITVRERTAAHTETVDFLSSNEPRAQSTEQMRDREAGYGGRIGRSGLRREAVDHSSGDHRRNPKRDVESNFLRQKDILQPVSSRSGLSKEETTFNKTTRFFEEDEIVRRFPKFKIDGPHDATTLPDLADHLSGRIPVHRSSYSSIQAEERIFHERLRNLLRHNTELHREERDIRGHLHERDETVQSLKRNIQKQLDIQHALVANSTLSERDKQELVSLLNKRDASLRDQITRRKDYHTELKGNLHKVHKSREHEFERRLGETKSAFEARVDHRETRLKRVRDALSVDDSGSNLMPSAPTDSSPSSTWSSAGTRNIPIERSRDYRRIQQVTPSPNSTSSSNIPFHNPKYGKRRSKSYDVLEHRARNHAPLGTRLRMGYDRGENHKAVTKVNMTDAMKSSTYVLQDQKATPDGSIETRIYKGEFIPTSGGGRSMILRDVEVLRQEDPVPLRNRVETSVNSSPSKKVTMIREIIEEKYRRN